MTLPGGGGGGRQLGTGINVIVMLYTHCDDTVIFKCEIGSDCYED